MPFTARPRFAQASLECETSLRQHALHSVVVVTGVRLDSVQFRIGAEQVVDDPSSCLRTEPTPSMPARDPKIEQWRAFTDVAKIHYANETNGFALIRNPEAGDVGRRKLHLRDVICG